MSKTKYPGRGTEVKYNISITANLANYTMDDFDFSVIFYGGLGVVKVEKAECIRVDANNYLAIVDTALTGPGNLDAKVTAQIPDADCPDGLRTEVAIVSGIEKIY